MSEIDIRPIVSLPKIEEVERVQKAIWGSEDLEILPAHTLHALAENGAALIGAYDGEKLVGYVFGVLGTIESPDRIDQVAAARLKMYSVIAGVLQEYQGKGIGFKLKLAQRDFALRVGIRLITWTYDPLESRNGRFNLSKLGVVCRQYMRNHHGEMSGINAGLATDRFEAEWWITGNRAEGRVVKHRGPISLDALLEGGAKLVNETSFDDRGMARPPESYGGAPDSNLILVEIPADFQRMKRENFLLAVNWRTHTREIFEDLFHAGYMVTDFVYQPHPEGLHRSFYLLTYGDA